MKISCLKVIVGLALILPGIVFAKELKVGFYVDAELKGRLQLKSKLPLEASLENALSTLNVIYRQSGIDIQVKLAGIEYKNLNGEKNGPNLVTNMKTFSFPFNDIGQFRDFNGADFVFTVVDGLSGFAGWSSVNASYSSHFDAEKLRLLNACIKGGGGNFNECFSSGKFKTPRWLKKVDDSLHDAGRLTEDYTFSLLSGVDDLGHAVVNLIPEPIVDVFESVVLDGIAVPILNVSLRIDEWGVVQSCRILKAVGLVDRTVCEILDLPNIGDSKHYVGTLDFQPFDGQVLGHEMGHIMGMIHGEHVSKTCGKVQNPYDALGEGLTNYSLGYGIGDCIRDNDDVQGGDIMNDDYYNPEKAVSPVFSSPIPNANCLLPGGICGAAKADTVRAINENLNWYDNQDTDVRSLNFPDVNLKECIYSTAPKELNQYKAFNCSSKNINSIEGLAQLAALESVVLDGNSIRDISVLLKLDPKKVKSISLKGNNQIMCHQLDDLALKFNQTTIIKPDACFNIGAFVAVNALLLR